MVSSPKAIDFPKQRVKNGIYSNHFSSLKDLAWYLLSCSSEKHKTIKIGKHSDWNMVSIPVAFMLINPRTCNGVLSLLYYARTRSSKLT